MREKLISNQKRNVIIVGVIVIINTLLILYSMPQKLNIISIGLIASLLLIMWLSSIKGNVISGVIGCIIAILILINGDILSIVLGIALIFDSVKYITQIGKA